MPSYKALQPGFFGGLMYDPNGKRPILDADKPLKPVPSWLEEIKGETAAQKKSRQSRQEKQKKADAEKAKEDQADVATVTFTEAPKQSGVETL